jgi:hypothetical protein
LASSLLWALELFEFRRAFVHFDKVASEAQRYAERDQMP